jgi:hypothetical protein
VLTRVRPHVDALKKLAGDSGINISLQLVRYFNDQDDGVEDVLGWHISRADLQFLAEISASIDSDEYGL